MIITNAALQALRTAFRAEFDRVFNSTPSDYERISTIVPSTTTSNTYGWLGDFPEMREWVGSRVVKDLKEHAYSIINKLWESTVGVQRTDIEDDNLGLYKPKFAEMGRVAKVHPDKLVFQLLKAGETTLCFDGQNFFDTDHPVYPNADGTGTAATVSNLQSGAGTAWYLLDTSRALKPIIYQERVKPEFQAMTEGNDEQVFDKDQYRYGVRARNNVGFGFWQLAYKSKAELDEANFNAAYAAMSSQVADGGSPLGVMPTLLVVPPNLRDKGLALVKAANKANGATNVNAGAVELLVTPWVL